MKINLRRQDCHEYGCKRGEELSMVLLAVAVMALLSYFFYRSIWAFPALSPIGVFCFRSSRRKKRERYKEELTSQFRECILSAATSLQAGYSAENAFVECGKDMQLMYGENAAICRELGMIRRGLNINITLEELLQDFARRSRCEEIMQFAQIFALAKRNGGNMAVIIRSSAVLIGKRIELRQELRTLLAGRRMELNIMRAMPFGILFYVNIGNPGYFNALYHNLTGVAVMTGCMAVYLTACALGERVMEKMTAEV